MKQNTMTKKPARRQGPGDHETMFQTRHLRRELLGRMHQLKALRNGQRVGAQPKCTVDQILNEALAAGLETLRDREEERWI